MLPALPRAPGCAMPRSSLEAAPARPHEGFPRAADSRRPIPPSLPHSPHSPLRTFPCRAAKRPTSPSACRLSPLSPQPVRRQLCSHPDTAHSAGSMSASVRFDRACSTAPRHADGLTFCASDTLNRDLDSVCSNRVRHEANLGIPSRPSVSKVCRMLGHSQSFC